jgi:hypothetical protein
MIKISAEDMIDEAIRIVQDGGWIRGHAHTAEGHCVMGAFSTARINLVMRARGDVTYQEAWAVSARAYIDAMTKVNHQINHRVSCQISIPSWNDNLARDADEVIEMLKLAKDQQL